MQDGIRFGDLTFDQSFLFARSKDGREIKFTRSERALLLKFIRNPDKLLTRTQLLEAVTDSDISDRNVDYLVTRLRTKLGDSARGPTMIATQYGEGYVWIAKRVSEGAPHRALLVIGPVFGLGQGPLVRRGLAFLHRLQNAIDRQTAEDQLVVIDETWNPRRRVADDVRFSIDVSFYDYAGTLHCAAVLRDAATRQALKPFRLMLEPSGLPIGDCSVEDVASSITSAIWEHSARSVDATGPKETPLELRMHEAAVLLTRPENTWAVVGEQLAAERRAKPDDPQVNLMWAMHLYLRILQNIPDIENRQVHEDEIRRIVFAHLAACQDNPILMLAASKLLLIIGREHLDLAERLAEDAFAETSAFAAAFAGLGKVRMCRGRIEEAVDLYNLGIELAEPDSSFKTFLMVLRCGALLASGDRAAIDTACAELYTANPATRLGIGLFYVAPEALPDDLERVFASFDVARCRQMVGYTHYFSGRAFEREEHRENIMRGLLTHVMNRFGTDGVPEEVWESVPRLRASNSGGNLG